MRFSDWSSDVCSSDLMHADMDNQGFWLNNGLFMAILLSLSLWASRSRSALAAFVFLSWASGNLFWNFIFHVVTTVYADSYSPGLVSASLLYYPVAIWAGRSEEHTSELQSLMRISYAVFCLKKKNKT